MCGIAGKYLFDANASVERKDLETMADAIKHRGPDDRGFLVDKNVGLTNLRLAIIDLSPNGRQPIPNEDETAWVVLNGEIYNFKELRAELEGRGHRFRSQTDTECIVHLYEEYGIGCLERLRGMFALAIWDKTKRELILARDRLGKKPLKYYLDRKQLVFASELKAILKTGVKAEPDWGAIHHYLSFQYCPTPSTGFVGIKKLPPAHYAVVRPNGSMKIERYWKLDFSKKEKRSEKEWEDAIMDTLEESVRLRLISDVPLGAFLSGGVDSSIVVGLMSKLSNAPVKTFSIGFEEAKFDETRYARLVAKLFNTDHREFTVRTDALDIIPKLAYAYEEPYADSSAIPTWYLSELTRKYVTVALNGDGGDENFAGYRRYNLYRLALRYASLPAPLRNGGLRLLRGALRFWKHPRQEKALRFISGMTERTPHQSYLELISYFSEGQKQLLYTDDFKERTRKEDSLALFEETLRQTGANDPMDAIFAADISSYLPDDLLAKVDIASMAHSLEARSPLLDHKLLELTASMPSSLKLKGNANKYILKQAAKHLLPEGVLRRPKQGFGVPITEWFRGELYGFLKKKLLSERATERNLLKKTEVERLIEMHRSGKTNYAHHLWALLMLEEWFEAFLD